MSVGQSDILEQYSAALFARNGRIRVWSLVVTIFGDAIEPRGGVFRLGALQLITNRIGIEGNALRTAMSRLASDGWLERQRIGRASYYSLSEMAAQENAKASELIYDLSPHKHDGQWSFVLSTKKDGYTTDDRLELHELGYAFYGRKLAVTPEIEGKKSLVSSMNDTCIFDAHTTQQNATQEMLSNLEFHLDCSSQYDDFVSAAESLYTNLEKQPNVSSLDALALRSLLIHSWRRIVLKDVYWPASARPKSWPGHKARKLVSQIYKLLLPQSERWLDKTDSIPAGQLPEPSTNLSDRLSG